MWICELFHVPKQICLEEGNFVCLSEILRVNKDHFNIYEIYSIQVWTASFLSYLFLTLELFFYLILKEKKKKKKWSDHLTCLLRNLYAGQETTVRTGHRTNGSELGKEYNTAAYFHLVYLTYMQRGSCKIWGWINHKLESRFLGKIPTTSYMQMDDTTLTAEIEDQLKCHLMRVKEESEKVDLKLYIQKTKIMASDPSLRGK